MLNSPHKVATMSEKLAGQQGLAVTKPLILSPWKDQCG